jgi:hypothetical protein
VFELTCVPRDVSAETARTPSKSPDASAAAVEPQCCEASLRLIDDLDREIADCERELRRLGAYHRYVPLLCSVPGISWVLAYTIAAEIRNIHRFPTPRKLAGYMPARLPIRRPRPPRPAQQARTPISPLGARRSGYMALIEAGTTAGGPFHPDPGHYGCHHQYLRPPGEPARYYVVWIARLDHVAHVNEGRASRLERRLPMRASPPAGPSPLCRATSGELVSGRGNLDRLRGRLCGRPLLGRLLRPLLRHRIFDRLDPVGLLWLSDVHAPHCSSATSSPNSIASASSDGSLADATITGTP